MSDEIYVNIGTSFQQPYQGQGVAQGNRPVAQAQYIARRPIDVQTPFTYQNRQPANARQPSNSQTPYIANSQVPSIVQATANYTYTASAQQPYPYIANSQTPYIANARQPLIYQANTRNPFTYARQGTAPVIAQGRQPSTYARQGQEPYSYQQSFQQPYATQGPTTYTYETQGQYPTTYQRQGTQPYSFQQPYQTPSIYTAQVTTNYQVTYQHPTIYQHQAQQTYQHPTTYQQPYRHPVTAVTTYRHPVIAQTPVGVDARRPVEYTYPDPILLGPFKSTSGAVPPGYGYSSYLNGFKGNGSPFAPIGNNPVGSTVPVPNGGWPQNPGIPWSLNSGMHYTLFTPGSATTGTLYVGNVWDAPNSTYKDLGPAGAGVSYFVMTVNVGAANEATNTFPAPNGTFVSALGSSIYWYAPVSIQGAGSYVANTYQSQTVTMY